MSDTACRKCERCGAVVPEHWTDGLCPACLMSGALTLSGGDVATASLVSGAPARQFAEFPFDLGGYTLRGLLGRGGMGSVYEAEQHGTGRRLALKVLGQELDSHEMRERFLREGRLAASINHPNSLYVFGSEEIDGLPVITMEIAGGGTLKDLLKRRGPLPVPDAVDAIIDVISGLEAASANGVLHRDVKPSNCFVTPEGSVKIGDFGLSVSTIARADTSVTAQGKVMGTPAYASPEQLRGDELDQRSDIYSVGATLFTLLTDHAPFEGENAVQVVANAVKEDPPPLNELRSDVPARLARIVDRCLAKQPDARFADYASLRDALLPFSSRESKPASMLMRAFAGWIDFLIAFLPTYVVLMFLVGAEEVLVRPLADRTLYAARYYLLLIGVGALYFCVTEGVWGAGIGKRLAGLRVVRPDHRPPGIGRGLVRVLIPLLTCECIRMPLSMALVSGPEWSGIETGLYVITAVVCGSIPGLLALRARQENGFATAWDAASGTKVVVMPKEVERPAHETCHRGARPAEVAEWMGPYRVQRLVSRDAWLEAIDPVLKRPVWLLRRRGDGFSRRRRDVARPGRLRWLQQITGDGTVWEAVEALRGEPFRSLIEGGNRVPWVTLRHLLHDLALELWEATADGTLPGNLSLDHIWVTAQGRAVLLDEPWPSDGAEAERKAVDDLSGQLRFLSAVADTVDATSVPLHTRAVLANLASGKIEKLSFLAGTLRGQLDRPSRVSRGIRFGSIFMLPVYVCIAVYVGRYHDKDWAEYLDEIAVTTPLMVMGAIALLQLFGVPLRSTASHTIFRLAVVDSRGRLASQPRLLARWATVWLPLLVPLALVASAMERDGLVRPVSAMTVVVIWIAAAAFAVFNPRRGLHDRLAGTWILRQ